MRNREIMICKRKLFRVIMQREACVATPSSCPRTFPPGCLTVLHFHESRDWNSKQFWRNHMIFILPRDENLPKGQNWALLYDFGGEMSRQVHLKSESKSMESARELFMSPGTSSLAASPSLVNETLLVQKQPALQVLKQEQWQEQEMARTRTFHPVWWCSTWWRLSLNPENVPWDVRMWGVQVCVLQSWLQPQFCHSSGFCHS